MKKLTKKSLDELSKVMPTLSEEVQCSLIGGGTGTRLDPYTVDEFRSISTSGYRFAGYVQDYDGKVRYTIFPGEKEHDSQESGNKSTISHQEISNQFYYNSIYGSYSGFYDASGYISGELDIYAGFISPNWGGGGGGGGDDQSSSKNKHDGVDLSNTKNFSFDEKMNPAFKSQISKILESNSVIKNLLSYADKGIFHLNFKTDFIKEKKESNGTTYTIAGTNVLNMINEIPVSFQIRLNTYFIVDGKWKNTHTGSDNMGYPLSKAMNQTEKLVITLAHEAIHFNHLARFNDVKSTIKQREAQSYFVIKRLEAQGYSQEFIDIFYIRDNRGIRTRPKDDQKEKMHKYMEKYDKSIIDAALEEYRKEH